MASRDHIERQLPGIDEIGDRELRGKVIDTWAAVMAESAYDDMSDVPWFPTNTEVGDEKQLPHLEDVVGFAIPLADQFGARRDISIDRDLVVAGAILHDISKPFEFSGDSMGELGEWIPHPHYAIHILERFEYSLPLQNLVLAHSHRSSVPPMTIEAKIVQLADWAASHAIYWENLGELYHNIP
jgi:hypothetical protein